jgi:trehalose synthase
MLRDLVPYVRAAGIDCAWIAMGGDADFYAITKRIHYGLYGFAGDGGPLGPAEHRHYQRVHAAIGERLAAFVRPGDLMLVHDPQPLGSAAALRAAGARVVWRCHVGRDEPNEHTEEAWAFLQPYLEPAEAYVFHRRQFAPSFMDASRVVAIAPSIEPLGAKNRPIDATTAARIVGFSGLRQCVSTGPVPFTRRDGQAGSIHRRADVLQSGPPAPADAPLVVQISRWDPMKDMIGVMSAFAEHLPDLADAHLLLVGPSVAATSDDPDGARVLVDCMAQWRRLPHDARARIHLACLPMADLEENAFTVNALQRQADIVVQKSVAEGFGLTVAEAMWKSRPVVASAVGGIQDQLSEGAGVLVAPNDAVAFGSAVSALLRNPAELLTLGAAAHRRVAEVYLPDRHLLDFAALFARLADGAHW